MDINHIITVAILDITTMTDRFYDRDHDEYDNYGHYETYCRRDEHCQRQQCNAD